MGKIIKFKTLYQKNFELMEKTQKKQKHPIFNGEWEILSSLGEGNTSKVYLCRSLKDHKQQIALKLLREEFLNRDEHSIKSVEQEIQILHGLNHMNIVYIYLEYVPGGLLFDLCQTMGGMGEDGGRYFLNLKIADFGFATYKKIDRLKSYRGTMTYMAPEI